MTDEEKKAKKKERDRRYYERHKEQVNERNRKWRTEKETTVPVSKNSIH